MLCGGEKMEQKLRRDRNLGDNLRRLRNASGRSQEKLCAELQRRGCDIGRTTYAKYEAGERNVRVSVLLALKSSTAVRLMPSSWGSTRRTTPKPDNKTRKRRPGSRSLPGRIFTL